MKESTVRIGDGRTDGRTDTHDRTGSECFPSRWPEINKLIINSWIYPIYPNVTLKLQKFKFIFLLIQSFISVIGSKS